MFYENSRTLNACRVIFLTRLLKQASSDKLLNDTLRTWYYGRTDYTCLFIMITQMTTVQYEAIVFNAFDGFTRYCGFLCLFTFLSFFFFSCVLSKSFEIVNLFFLLLLLFFSLRVVRRSTRSSRQLETVLRRTKPTTAERSALWNENDTRFFC